MNGVPVFHSCLLSYYLETEVAVFELGVDDEDERRGETRLASETDVLLTVEVRQVDEVILKVVRFDNE